MRLIDLPVEILDAVAEYIPAKALRKLAFTCSILHEVALKQLWYQVRIDFSRAKGGNYGCSHMGRLFIHKKPSEVTAFEIDCFCRRSSVRITKDGIGPLLTHHSKRPLPFAYVRRLLITLGASDYKFVDAFRSYKTRQCNIFTQEEMHWYSQLFEIIPNLNLTTILVIPVHSFTPTPDMFKMVDYLSTLSPAPVYMSMRCRSKQSTFGQAELNMSNLRMLQLDFTSSARTYTKPRALLKEFLQNVVIPSLEKINLCCERQITAAMEDFESFFACCKALKVLRLHGVYPLGTTVNWIPSSVTILHLLGTDGRSVLTKPGKHFEDFVTVLPNVTELLFSGSEKRPLPISPRQLFLPNLRKLILKGNTIFEASDLDFILRKYCQSVQDFRAYDLSYGQLAPFIHKVLPLQTLIVDHFNWIRGEKFSESWPQFIPQLHDIDAAILTADYEAVKDCNSTYRTLRENKVHYIIIYSGMATGPPTSKPSKRLGFYMSCDICSRSEAPFTKSSQKIVQSFNH